ATQTKSDEKQNQGPQQGQVMTRRSQPQGLSRSSGYLLPYFTPADIFRMNPFSVMRRMTEELDHAFGESNGREQREKTWMPAVEVMEREGNVVVRAELPGLKPEDVKLEITDDALIIEGERKDEREENKGGVHVTERRYGRFYRAIPLPDGAKTDDARANFENGVLEVTVPAEEPKSKRREIPIQGASQTAKGGVAQEPAGSSKPTGASDKAA
ncbi:MAG TPA: Hsp20/alpha crystallin family protein, partial [Bryobacteraceae bacterium]|nr:Hsp20/alpha crystallin family protein [Bryobacteraceae bacterium]